MKVNGKKIILKEPINLKIFLEQNNYDIQRTVVELNKKIISKNKYNSTILYDDAIIEILTFVGGG